MALDTTRPISTDGDPPDLPHDNYTVFCHYEGDSGSSPSPVHRERLRARASQTVRASSSGTTTTRPGHDLVRDGEPAHAREGCRGHAPVHPALELVLGDPRRRAHRPPLEIGYPAGPLPLYGEDNLPDPWSNPQIQLLQKAYNPVAAVDTDFWNENKLSNAAGQWPRGTVGDPRGREHSDPDGVQRHLHGRQLNVTWSLHQGAPEGPVIDGGTLTADVALGERAELPSSFTAPTTPELLYLDVRVEKPGQGILFQDASTVYQVETGVGG